jgi:LPXTG-motif cell wall-anchored protein
VKNTNVAPRAPRIARFTAAAVAALVVGSGAATVSAPTAEAAAVFPATFIGTSATTWSYSDNNTDPAAGSADRTSWTSSSFDDSKWKAATGAFGAKGGQATGIGANYPIKTLLNQYINGTTTPDVKTYHFRSSFDLTAEQLAEISALRGEIVIDDAAQVFVNGDKVAGYIDGAIEAAPASERNLMYAGSSGGDPVAETLTINAADLQVGENTIAVALYQDRATSSDIYFDFKSLTPVLATPPVVPAVPLTLSDLVLTIGADETSRNVTWYSNIDAAQVVQVAKASDMIGTAFPTKFTSIAATGGVTTSGEQRRSATIAGLAENTDYVYRVGNVDKWSDTYDFSTQSFSGDYDFLFVGDPQIGASRNVPSDQAGWVDTLNVAQKAFPDSEMIFSAGDQVETAGNEEQYAAFLAPEQLREIPLVPTNGNHDVGSKAYEQHYTVPNNDPTSGAATSATASGGDYWFMYKDVLYMNINSNNSNVASHQAFLEKVVAEQGANAKWKVLAFHHSIYSVADHYKDTKILDLRKALPPIISDLGIDLVLQGHDHSYTRSFLLNDGNRANAKELAGQTEVTAKEGDVLYVTANSASGSKYYPVEDPNAFYASVINQENVRNYSHIEVTDESITVDTLRSQGSGANVVNSVVDSVTLKKADVVAPELTIPVDSSIAIDSDFDSLTGVSASDVVDGDVTAKIAVTGTVDTTTVGTYTLNYSVKDAAGNTSTATRTVTVTEGAFVTVTPATIAGPAAVVEGTTLTAAPGTFTPAPTLIGYQWLRNGVAIAGATSASYTTTGADTGTSLSVRETATRVGYADATSVSGVVVVSAVAVPVPEPTDPTDPTPVPDPTTGPTPAPTTAPTTPAPTTNPTTTPTTAPVAVSNGSNGSTGSNSGNLASTGADITGGLFAAVMLLLAGGVFLVVRRVRKRA